MLIVNETNVCSLILQIPCNVLTEIVSTVTALKYTCVEF